MSKSNKHQLQDDIFEYALGLMPEPRRTTFANRLKKDPVLRDQVFDIQTVHQSSLEKLPVPEAVPDMSNAILRRIQQQPAEPSARPVSRLYRIGLVAACVLLSILSIMTFRLWNAVKDQQALAVQFKEQIDQPSTSIADANQTRLVISSLKSPDAPRDQGHATAAEERQLMQLTVMSESIWQLVDLDTDTGRALPNIPRGYILMDTENRRGYVAIDDLQNAEDRILHIWLKLDNAREPVFAGILPTLNENKGLLYFDFATILDERRSHRIEEIFVTEETQVNRSAPSGKVLLQSS